MALVSSERGVQYRVFSSLRCAREFSGRHALRCGQCYESNGRYLYRHLHEGNET